MPDVIVKPGSWAMEIHQPGAWFCTHIIQQLLLAVWKAGTIHACDRHNSQVMTDNMEFLCRFWSVENQAVYIPLRNGTNPPGLIAADRKGLFAGKEETGMVFRYCDDSFEKLS